MNELFVLTVGEKTTSKGCIIRSKDATLYWQKVKYLWYQGKWMLI